MVSNTETFRKSERLCSKKIIAGLFESGNSFYCAPFQIVWANSPSEIPFPAQVAFSISKKSFRHAVTRNLIKRRIKEAYRKNKYLLYDFLKSKNITVVLIMIFKDKSVPDYKTVEGSVQEMIRMLIHFLDENQDKC